MYCMAVSKGMNECTHEYVPFQRFYELAGPPRWLSGEESCDNLGDTGLVPGSERLNGNPFNLVWEIPWTEEPGKLQSTGSQQSQTGLSD